MSRVVALVLSLLAAFSGQSNPWLDQVCEDIRPEATPGETLATALAAAKKPPPCDLNADRGICLHDGTKVYIDARGGASAVPVVALQADEYKERPIYVYTAFDTNAGGKKRAADVYIDGKALAVGLPADQPIHVEGYLRRLPTGGWHHIALVRSAGKEYRLELPVDVTFVEGAATDVALKGIIGNYSFDDSAGQDLSSRSRIGDKSGEVTVGMSVPFYTVQVE